MSDEALTNAAAERFRKIAQFLNDAESLPDAIALSGDFRFEDRRSGGVGAGPLDSSLFHTNTSAFWDVGSGRPVFSITEVVAIRGPRCAAGVHDGLRERHDE